MLGIGMILFTACNEKEKAEEIVPIIPYKTGNRWTYESSTGGMQQKAVSTDRSTMEVGEYVEVDGNKGYRIVGSCSSFLVRNDENGNVLEIGGYAENNKLFAPSIRYKKNAVKGEKWIFNIITEDCTYYSAHMPALFERNSVVMTCSHADTLIRTSKGQFRCKAFSYTPDNGINVYTDYVSDGIGRIKGEHYEDGQMISQNELIDYTLIK